MDLFQSPGIVTTDGLRGSIPLLVPKLNTMSRTIKQARKAKAKSCMNNGGCPYCKRNRLHSTNKKLIATTYSLNTINN
jgi:succinylarginine dihydrolase